MKFSEKIQKPKVTDVKTICAALPQHDLYKQNWYGDDCLSTLIRIILTIFNLDLMGIQIPSPNLSLAFLIFNGPKIQFRTFSERF